MSEGALEFFEPMTISSDTLSINFDFDDYLAMKLVQQRNLELFDEIGESNSGWIVRSILQINRMDAGIPPKERIPIKLFISSQGGDVFSGLSIIDVIKNSITPVYTINMSYWYSMAILIGISGHKRYASKNASFLIHDGSSFVYDSSSKAHDYIQFDLKIQERMKKHVLENTNISTKRYNKKAREEWYFFSDEAKEMGVIDGIIGEDLTIEQII